MDNWARTKIMIGNELTVNQVDDIRSWVGGPHRINNARDLFAWMEGHIGPDGESTLLSQSDVGLLRKMLRDPLIGAANVAAYLEPYADGNSAKGDVIDDWERKKVTIGQKMTNEQVGKMRSLVDAPVYINTAKELFAWMEGQLSHDGEGTLLSRNNIDFFVAAVSNDEKIDEWERTKVVIGENLTIEQVGKMRSFVNAPVYINTAKELFAWMENPENHPDGKPLLSRNSITMLRDLLCDPLISAANVAVRLKSDENSRETQEKDTDDDNLCVVCLEAKKTLVFLPCAHVCTCEECGLKESISQCPICRGIIEQRKKVFL